MNTNKLFALVRAFADLGLSPDEAFSKAFAEYSAIKKAQKESEKVVSDLVTAAGMACCEGVEA